MKSSGATLLLLALAACSGEVEPALPPAPAPPPSLADPRLLRYATPPEWTPQTPISKLRKAQYALPDKDKTEGDAELVYAGLVGGGQEANIKRWRGQFRNRDGEPKIEETTAGGFPATIVEIAGDYAPDMGGEPQDDATMLAAIVSTPEGEHYFKLVGPRGTVGDWKSEFVAMIRGAKRP